MTVYVSKSVKMDTNLLVYFEQAHAYWVRWLASFCYEQEQVNETVNETQTT